MTLSLCFVLLMVFQFSQGEPNPKNTIIDGGWSKWNVGTCSKTCGGGTRTNTRHCNSPKPTPGCGKKCIGKSSQVEKCNVQQCPICKASVDVGYLLDSSGSIQNDYKKEKAFLKSLAATFGVTEKGSRASVITFADNAKLSIKLNSFKDLLSFNQAVDKIPFLGGGTRIDLALRLAQKEMFTSANGGRPDITKVLVVLTDGQSGGDPGKVADELRKSGIRVLAVGIGKNTNNKELAKIGGGVRNVYSATTFSQLNSREFVDKITEGACVEAWSPWKCNQCKKCGGKCQQFCIRICKDEKVTCKGKSFETRNCSTCKNTVVVSP